MQCNVILNKIRLSKILFIIIEHLKWHVTLKSALLPTETSIGFYDNL